MDPHTGNVLLGYARINVKDGLRKLFEGPLTDAHFAAPSLASLSKGIDVRRARYDAERRMLAVTLEPGAGRVDACLAFDNSVQNGMPEVIHDGGDTPRLSVAGDRLEMRFDLSRRTNLVLAW